MEVLVTTGAVSRAKLQSNHHHQQINIQLFTGRMPFTTTKATPTFLLTRCIGAQPEPNSFVSLTEAG